jgi:putative ABC transport system permease protein
MEIGPILRAMTRNRLGVLLIALQIAFTMTVIINAIFIINERSRLMARPSGLDEANTFFVNSIGFGDDFSEEVMIRDDLQLLRQLPGVASASFVNSVPLTSSGSGTGVRVEDSEDSPSIFTAVYRSDEHIIDTMDLNLIAGEGFAASDMYYREMNAETGASKAIITEALSAELYPDEAANNAVGRTIFMPDGNPLQIVGVVERLQQPWPSNFELEQSMIVPENIIDTFSRYLIRTEPGERDRLMGEVEELLQASSSNRIVRGITSLEEAREDVYRVDSAMSSILWFIVITLVFITCMGIVGLAVFGINRRRKQIGTRRALGATRFEILRYFLVENILISAVGVTIGAVLTLALSILLTTSFNMPAMAWYYTPLGMLMLLIIGQLAVLGPSSRAANIEPATATRSV